jgi:hypothetical protein
MALTPASASKIAILNIVVGRLAMTEPSSGSLVVRLPVNEGRYRGPLLHLGGIGTYVLAAGWGPSPFQQFGKRLKDDRGWQFVSMACGYDVMVDRPQELADVLIAAAQA